MKHFLIFLFSIITISLSSQAVAVRTQIQDYASVTALRNETLKPRVIDKVFIKSIEKIYFYDPTDTSTPDDGINIIAQGIYRWKCFNCSLGGGISDGNKGDITVTGDNWQLTTNAVEAINIIPNAVTTAKIADQNVTSNKLAITGVTAGTYSNPTFTVNTKGQITEASTTDSLNISDGTNTFRYLNGELEIFNTVNNKSVAFQNGRIHIARDGEDPDQDTDVLIRSEIVDLIAGSRWHFVSALSDTTTTVVNPNTVDFLLNITNGFVYERPLGYWNYKGTLKGATGTAGATGATGPTGENGINGTQIRTGIGAPSNGTGVNGDLYLNTTNGDLYEKDAGIYSVTDNLTGPSGPAGGTGATGPTGSTGPQGKGFINRSAWSNAVTDYVNNSISIDFVTNNGNTYYCILSHNASSTANDEPGTGSSWQTYWAIMSAKGDTGSTGSAGVGVPSGGTTGQVLAKNSSTDYDTEWIDAPSGGGGSVSIRSVRLTGTGLSVLHTLSQTWVGGKTYKIDITGSFSVGNVSFRPAIYYTNAGTGADMHYNFRYNTNTTTSSVSGAAVGATNQTDCHFIGNVNVGATSTIYPYVATMYIFESSSGTGTIELGQTSITGCGETPSGTGITWQPDTIITITEY